MHVTIYHWVEVTRESRQSAFKQCYVADTKVPHRPKQSEACGVPPVTVQVHTLFLHIVAALAILALSIRFSQHTQTNWLESCGGCCTARKLCSDLSHILWLLATGVCLCQVKYKHNSPSPQLPQALQTLFKLLSPLNSNGHMLSRVRSQNWPLQRPLIIILGGMYMCATPDWMILVNACQSGCKSLKASHDAHSLQMLKVMCPCKVWLNTVTAKTHQQNSVTAQMAHR